MKCATGNLSLTLQLYVKLVYVGQDRQRDKIKRSLKI